VQATEITAGDEFMFTNVPDGNYNIVATDGTYSKTMRLLIEDGVVVYPVKYIDLVLSGKNTSVVITTEDTPNVTVDDMDTIFELDTYNYTSDDALLVNDGGTVEFKLYATLMTVTSVSSDEISAMYAVTDKNKVVGAYLDLSLYKYVTDTDGAVERTRVTELAKGANVSVTIPLGDLAGKSGLEVVRIHDTGDRYVGSSLADMDSNPSTYTISTTQFSTYAVLYDPNPSTSSGNTTSGVTSGTSSVAEGTASPSQSGALYAQAGTSQQDPDADDDDDDDDNSTGSSSTTPTTSSGSSVGSLRSSGTAKTGDATPIAVLGMMMIISLSGFVFIRRKIK
jgi:LPXTG-motif cell wall-anchored protein